MLLNTASGLALTAVFLGRLTFYLYMLSWRGQRTSVLGMKNPWNLTWGCVKRRTAPACHTFADQHWQALELAAPAALLAVLTCKLVFTDSFMLSTGINRASRWSRPLLPQWDDRPPDLAGRSKSPPWTPLQHPDGSANLQACPQYGSLVRLNFLQHTTQPHESTAAQQSSQYVITAVPTKVAKTADAWALRIMIG